MSARRKLSKPFPWLTRIDVGMHTGGLNDAERSADWPKGKPKFFLNEIEIVPTYYIAKQFRHQVSTHARLPLVLAALVFALLSQQHAAKTLCCRVTPVPRGVARKHKQ